MFILVGELEFNEKWFDPFGGPQSFLFVSTRLNEYVYAISPLPDPDKVHVGEIYRTSKHLSVPEFLQFYVDMDEQIGIGVIKSMAKCKVKLKGMTEWIERQPSEITTNESDNIKEKK